LTLRVARAKPRSVLTCLTIFTFWGWGTRLWIPEEPGQINIPRGTRGARRPWQPTGRFVIQLESLRLSWSTPNWGIQALIPCVGVSRALELHSPIWASCLKLQSSLAILFINVMVPCLGGSRALEQDFPIWASCLNPIISSSVLFVKILTARVGTPEA